MKRIEKLAKQYGCSESVLRRALVRALMRKFEMHSNGSLEVQLVVSEGEIQEILRAKGLTARKRTTLALMKT